MYNCYWKHFKGFFPQGQVQRWVSWSSQFSRNITTCLFANQENFTIKGIQKLASHHQGCTTQFFMNWPHLYIVNIEFLKYPIPFSVTFVQYCMSSRINDLSTAMYFNPTSDTFEWRAANCSKLLKCPVALWKSWSPTSVSERSKWTMHANWCRQTNSSSWILLKMSLKLKTCSFFDGR